MEQIKRKYVRSPDANPDALAKSRANLNRGGAFSPGKPKTLWHWSTQIAVDNPELLEVLKTKLRLEADKHEISIPVLLGQLVAEYFSLT